MYKWMDTSDEEDGDKNNIRSTYEVDHFFLILLIRMRIGIRIGSRRDYWYGYGACGNCEV